MEEIWKDIVGYEGIYKVSNAGRIKSLKFNKEKFLKLSCNSAGYFRFALCLKGKEKLYYVHQIVAQLFLEHKPCGYKLVIDHINDIKTDNRVENLQIVTQRFNCRKTQGKNTSQYKGVSWQTKGKRWRADININKKKIYLGLFIDEYEAHLAYQNALKNIEL
tara:strand:+ start:925 stop:1410 length:486 start_codon:yes stop_codon:yes gene_type:complete